MRAAFVLFILVPILEMYVLIKVGTVIGAWPTVGLVLLTAVAGVNVLRRQGLATLKRGMRRLDAGDPPAREVVEGVFLAVAGVLLLVPGFLTDGVALVLLVPPCRHAIASAVLRRMIVRTPGGPPAGGGRVIEGDYERRP